MHREGYGLVFAFFLSSVLFSFAGWSWGGGTVLKTIAILAWIFTLFTVYFFRDPDRRIPDLPGAIVSPADGKIIEISEVEEPEFFKARTKKVSIFLNIFNVHVNRAPIGGTVKYFRYQKGKFFRANLERASLENEQTIVGVQNGDEKLVFKQIAGLVARRVFCDVREGHKIKRGERIGIIKFGSRMDIFMPMDAELRVTLGQKVLAGETIIGVFKHVS